jgi:hypothetical protein
MSKDLHRRLVVDAHPIAKLTEAAVIGARSSERQRIVFGGVRGSH